MVSPLLSGPLTSPASSVTVASVATGGGVVSTVKVNPPDIGLVLPATSVAIAVRVCVPSPTGVVGVKVHAPLLPTTAVPISTPSRRMVIVEPGSPVPLSVGVASLVVSLAPTGPVPTGTLSTSWVMAGASGAVPSMVMVQAFETLPLLDVAVSTWAPSASGVDGVKVHWPDDGTTTVPRTSTPLWMVMVEPGSAVPFRVGVRSLVIPFWLMGPVTPG